MHKIQFIYLRHGQTDGNAKQIMVGGEWDLPINEVGREQARQAFKKIKSLVVQPTHLYVSTLIRARETAQIVTGGMGLEVVFMDDLRESRLGEWNRKSFTEVGQLFLNRQDPVEGEPFAEFQARVERAFEAILCPPPKGIPLIVAHGGVWNNVCHFLGAEFFRATNCEPVLVSYEVSKNQPWRPGDRVENLKIERLG